MANQLYNLFGKKVSQTYHNLLQSGSDGKFYDGDGNEVTINATIPDIYATTGSNTFRGNQLISGSVNITSSFTASGLNYPSTDNGEFSFIQTDGNGNLSLQYVNTLYEVVYNGEATSIVKGTPIYISGSQGANSKAYQADAGNPLKMPVVYVTADTIAAGSTGRAIALGLITGVDTTGYPGGTEIYVAVGGGWTSTRPTGSAIVQILGYVTKEGNGGQGVILNPGPANLPNLPSGSVWVGNSGSVPVAVLTSSLSVKSALTASHTPNAITTASVDLNTITFTKGDGSTFPITVDTGSGGGGGGTPGGSTNQFQYNAGSSTFGGAPTLTYNPSTTYTTLTGSVVIPTGSSLTHTFNSGGLSEFRSDQFPFITRIIIPTTRSGSVFDLTALGYDKTRYNSLYFDYSLITTGSNNLIRRGEVKCVYDSNMYDIIDEYIEISGSAVRDITFDISQSSTNIFFNYTASAGLRSLTTTYLLKGIIKLL